MKSVIVLCKLKGSDGEWRHVTESVELGKFYISAHEFIQELKNMYNRNGVQYQILNVVIG